MFLLSDNSRQLKNGLQKKIVEPDVELSFCNQVKILKTFLLLEGQVECQWRK